MELRKVGLKFKKILKSAIKRKYTYEDWYKVYLLKRLNIEKKIPKYELQKRNINNLRILLNRDEMLDYLPKNSICAEVGVFKGEFSSVIKNRTHPKRLHLIDPWGDPKRYHDDLKKLVEEKFKEEIKDGNIIINVGQSLDVLKEFPDDYFDWVYLDTCHTYNVTNQELSILKNKVKKNGYISGHDYILCNWVGDVRYGVIEAVHELCVKDNWELIYLTIDFNEMPSFTIKRIS